MTSSPSFLSRLRKSFDGPQGMVGLVGLLGLVAVALPNLLDNDADLDSLANATAFAVLALGLNIVVGFAGLLDLGYAAFFAIGAYFYGVLTSFQIMPAWSPGWAPLAAIGLVEKLNQGGPDLVHFTLSFWLALPLAGLLAAVFGILFGAPTLRLRGDYLAIVTLGFGEIVPIVARNAQSVTNGAAGLNGVQAPRLFGSFGIDAQPYYLTGIGLLVTMVFVSLRLRDSRIGRALDGDPRGRDRRRRDGRGPRALQAAGLRHRRGVRRRHGRVLRGETADGDAGDVRLPGLGDDPGDGRIGRHGQRLGGGAGGGDPDIAAILVAARSHRPAARAGRGAEQRVAAAGRPRPLDRADLRHHPGDDDAVPPPGPDPGTASRAAADVRAAERLQRPARRFFRRGLARAARGGLYGRPAGARCHGALRRPGGARPRRHLGARRRRGRGDRAQRFGQVDAVQRDHRTGAGRRGQHHLRGARAARPATSQDPAPRCRADFPEHPAVPAIERARERHAGRALQPAPPGRSARSCA